MNINTLNHLNKYKINKENFSQFAFNKKIEYLLFKFKNFFTFKKDAKNTSDLIINFYKIKDESFSSNFSELNIKELNIELLKLKNNLTKNTVTPSTEILEVINKNYIDLF